MIFLRTFIAFLLLLSVNPAVAENCMKADKEGEFAEGRLDIGGFQDAAGRLESVYILTLSVPVCLSHTDPEYRVDSSNTIHIFSSNDAVHSQIGKFVGSTVFVRGGAFSAHTSHHHAAIVMDIKEIDNK